MSAVIGSVGTLEAASLPSVRDEAETLSEELNRELAEVEGIIRSALLSRSPHVTRPARLFVDRGGKRFRSKLVLLASKLLGSIDHGSRAGAAAVEMVHQASLIHDDIIDESTERRGGPALHIDEGIINAVLLGDLMYASAIDTLSQVGPLASVTVLSDALAVMATGELEQRERVRDFDLSYADYLRIIDAKTSSLISAALVIGGIAAGCSAEQREALAKFGSEVGTAFQILDDVADYESSRERQGRPPGNDVCEGRVTAPLILALQECSTLERRHIEVLFRSVPNDRTAIDELRALIARKDGFSRAKILARDSVERALPRLEHFPPSVPRSHLRKSALAFVEAA